MTYRDKLITFILAAIAAWGFALAIPVTLFWPHVGAHLIAMTLAMGVEATARVEA